MPDFSFEEMRFVPSPLEVAEQLTMPREGLIRARIIEPTTEDFSVLGYDFMWNKNGLSVPTETDQLKVVEFALGEASLDLTVALVLERDTQEEIAAMKAQMAEMEEEYRQQQRDRHLAQEQELLELKKRTARLDILAQASLTPDAIDLIKREVMTEHPDLLFPEDE